MQALKFETQVAQNGTLRLPRLRLKQGTPVEVIVLVREREGEFTKRSRQNKLTKFSYVPEQSYSSNPRESYG